MSALQRRSTNRCPAGFTILELLVVIGIIAVLVALLSATVGRIYERAKIVACASNERQLYLASINYANDNNNFLPCPCLIGEDYPQVTWGCPSVGVADFKIGSIWPYMPTSMTERQAALWCPSDSSEASRVGATYAVSRNFSYSFNISIRPSGTNTLMFRQIVQPTRRVLIYEEFGPNDGACFGPGDSDDWLSGRHGGLNSSSQTNNYNLQTYQEECYRNQGKANVCYFDGHVDLMLVSTYFSDTSHFGPLTQ